MVIVAVLGEEKDFGDGLVDPTSLNAFIDENIPGGVMRGAEWHSHLGSMKVCFIEYRETGIINPYWTLSERIGDFSDRAKFLLCGFLDMMALKLTNFRQHFFFLPF